VKRVCGGNPLPDKLSEVVVTKATTIEELIIAKLTTADNARLKIIAIMRDACQ
jgi:hypothetical protein